MARSRLSRRGTGTEKVERNGAVPLLRPPRCRGANFRRYRAGGRGLDLIDFHVVSPSFFSSGTCPASAAVTGVLCLPLPGGWPPCSRASSLESITGGAGCRPGRADTAVLSLSPRLVRRGAGDAECCDFQPTESSAHPHPAPVASKVAAGKAFHNSPSNGILHRVPAQTCTSVSRWVRSFAQAFRRCVSISPFHASARYATRRMDYGILRNYTEDQIN